MTPPLLTRLDQEARELERLAPYALASARTAGRRHPEPEHPFRTCFQRDRDRIIHCAAFRRLEAKTQVFLGDRGDYARTRLTHTMEVAQIARTLCRILSLNEDLAEAVALAHDLGHPPYGHCGEALLNELLAGCGGFEHNRHALRLVEYLEHPYPLFRGLNLAWETRCCLAKHRTRYDQPAPAEEYGPGPPPLEGQLVDLADAIAYHSHDLDDALAAELIREDDLADVRLYQMIRRDVDARYPHAARQARQLRCAKGLIDWLVSDCLEETARRLARRRPDSSAAVCRLDEPLAGLSPQAQTLRTELQDFLERRVYRHPCLLEAQQQARRELTALFQIYARRPELLPPRYRQRLDEQGLEPVVGDYLAGMTDRFCHATFAALAAHP